MAGTRPRMKEKNNNLEYFDWEQIKGSRGHRLENVKVAAMGFMGLTVPGALVFLPQVRARELVSVTRDRSVIHSFPFFMFHFLFMLFLITTSIIDS